MQRWQCAKRYYIGAEQVLVEEDGNGGDRACDGQSNVWIHHQILSGLPNEHEVPSLRITYWQHGNFRYSMSHECTISGGQLVSNRCRRDSSLEFHPILNSTFIGR